MKVEINVDETQLKDVLEKEMSDLPKDVIQNIIVECIKGYFECNNYKNIEKFFIKEDKGIYSWNKVTSTEFLNGLVRDCDYSELQSVVDESIKTLKENNENILSKIIQQSIIDGLFNNYHFQRCLGEAVEDIFMRRRS